MKLPILNDTHLGVRNDREIFLDLQKDFFDNIFFPYCDNNNITQILHGGDLFDRRKFINFKTLQKSEEFFFTPLEKRNIKMDVIAGNHDVFFKDTNEINSLRLTLNSRPNVEIIDIDPVVKSYDGVSIGLVPWITRDNQEKCLDFIASLNPKEVSYLLGHFEIDGFELLPGITHHDGLSMKLFNKFDEVWSGHFHHRSERGNIKYLGVQYPMTWSDASQIKGFHVFDTKTKELEFIENPKTIFKKIFYNDQTDDYQNYDFEDCRSKFIKIIITQKTNYFVYDRFIDKLQQVSPYNVSIVEDHQQELQDISEVLELEKSVDTMTLLDNYIDQNLDKDNKAKTKIKKILRELYTEALTIE